MAEDRLYRAAYAFYGTKLRKALRDSAASVQRNKYGRIGSRRVMGRLGSHAMGRKAFCDACLKLTGEPDMVLPAVNSFSRGVRGYRE